ncbi:hypothetical protein BS47DRAFT_1392675 [Hydnum rufescens UP504]|uniref:Uncharacterized protein n=1 Tax=Hydnum rufescens UP504 TaxID=1448309 RepID=A0A9P6DWT5_9AGAM|nr:hypothetical protein BS47DRAFT_1392675 [Hydnum rufescens UP504]
MEDMFDLTNVSEDEIDEDHFLELNKPSPPVKCKKKSPTAPNSAVIGNHCDGTGNATGENNNRGLQSQRPLKTKHQVIKSKLFIDDDHYDGNGGINAGGIDSSGIDNGGIDSRGIGNSGINDSGITDSGIADGGIADGGITDGGITDGGITDGGITDGGIADGRIDDGGIANGGIDDGRIDDGRIDGGGIDNSGIDDNGIDNNGIDNNGSDDGGIDTGQDDSGEINGSAAKSTPGQRLTQLEEDEILDLVDDLDHQVEDMATRMNDPISQIWLALDELYNKSRRNNGSISLVVDTEERTHIRADEIDNWEHHFLRCSEPSRPPSHSHVSTHSRTPAQGNVPIPQKASGHAWATAEEMRCKQLVCTLNKLDAEKVSSKVHKTSQRAAITSVRVPSGHSTDLLALSLPDEVDCVNPLLPTFTVDSYDSSRPPTHANNVTITTTDPSMGNSSHWGLHGPSLWVSAPNEQPTHNLCPPDTSQNAASHGNSSLGPSSYPGPSTTGDSLGSEKYPVSADSDQPTRAHPPLSPNP